MLKKNQKAIEPKQICLVSLGVSELEVKGWFGAWMMLGIPI